MQIFEIFLGHAENFGLIEGVLQGQIFKSELRNNS